MDDGRIYIEIIKICFGPWKISGSIERRLNDVANVYLTNVECMHDLFFFFYFSSTRIEHVSQ